MNTADLVAELESRFRCVDGIYRRVCQTGEPYELFTAIRETESKACLAILDQFNFYETGWRRKNDGERPVLYWRYAAPRIFWELDDEDGPHRGKVRTRLVLSALPVVDVPDADYDAARTAELQREIFGGEHGTAK